MQSSVVTALVVLLVRHAGCSDFSTQPDLERVLSGTSVNEFGHLQNKQSDRSINFSSSLPTSFEVVVKGKCLHKLIRCTQERIKLTKISRLGLCFWKFIVEQLT